MRKNIYLMIVAFIFIACSKEKFNNTNNYAVEYIFNIDGTTEESSVSSFVELRNETSNSIDFNNEPLEKKGRNITGTISSVFSVGTTIFTDSMQIDLKRNLFSGEIMGTLETRTFIAGQWRDTEGTIEMRLN